MIFINPGGRDAVLQGSVVVRRYWKMPHSAYLLLWKVAIETAMNFASSNMVTLR